MMEVDLEPPMGLPRKDEDRTAQARVFYQQSLRLARQGPARRFLERRLEELFEAGGIAG